MIDLRSCVQKFDVPCKGVVHIGGFDGAEDHTYQELGFTNRLFVEAQAKTFADLSNRLAASGAYCEHRAICNKNGSIDFHVAVNGQSSSILSLKKHLDVYPSIVEVGIETVRASRLDDMLAEPQYSNLDWNMLNIDIQGAEFLALSGATETLASIDMINIEINCDELYEGAPHISKLDMFLLAFDFLRVDTFLWHRSWGDAIYIKNRFTRV